MNRREIIAGLGSAAAWPVVARAQQGDRLRRIGVLSGLDENDPMAKNAVSAFTQALADLGWTDGYNVRIDLRWFGDDTNRIRALAQELVALQPDIIVTTATPATVAVQRDTRTIPIVFAGDTAGQGWGIDESRGGMRTYATMLRNMPDFFIHNGDNIYADGPILAEQKMPNGEVWKNLVIEKKPRLLKRLQSFEQTINTTCSIATCAPSISKFRPSRNGTITR
jgi:hypothetical protein